GRLQVGKLQQQIRQIALGVDDDAGNTVDGGLFEQGYRQAGFAGAGHADDDAVRDEVLRFVIDPLRLHGPGGEVVLAAEVKRRRLVLIGEIRRRGVVAHDASLLLQKGNVARIMRDSRSVDQFPENFGTQLLLLWDSRAILLAKLKAGISLFQL